MSPPNTLDIAYLVLAHQHSEQLSRLVEQLRSPAADIFVHVDAKVPIEPLSRLTDYHGRPGLLGRLLSKARRLLIKLHFMPSERDCKAYLGETAPYAGSTWWALTRDACQYIQTFVRQNPRFMKFFENTSSP